MKKMHYTIDIQAQPEQVYNTMLGLKDKKTYEDWTTPFNPSSSSPSTYEGSWNKGDKLRFIGVDENGKKMGMVSRVAENKPGEFVSIQHYGILENDVEITEGPKVEGWANSLENYTFEPTANGTKVKVDVDVNEEYLEYFDEAWPKALDKLKTISEQAQPGR